LSIPEFINRVKDDLTLQIEFGTKSLPWRCDIKSIDIQQNDTRYPNTQHDETEFEDAHYYETLRNGNKLKETQLNDNIRHNWEATLAQQ